MKNLLCREIQVDDNHNVMILFRENQYDCYVMQHDDTGSTPYMYMFGQVRKQPGTENLSLNDIIETAIAAAPEYYFMFKEEEVI